MLNESRVGRTLLSTAFDFEPHNFLDPQKAISTRIKIQKSKASDKSVRATPCQL
jgi:hypothetical protein